MTAPGAQASLSRGSAVRAGTRDSAPMTDISADPWPAPPHPDETPFELWKPERASTARAVVLCDHASNHRPSALGDLGLPRDDLARHIAYDIGARGVSLALAESLAAPAALTTFSRLVIDPNRGEDDPTLIMRLYDRSIIPGNRDHDHSERERRLETLHRPYHRTVATLLDAASTDARKPFLVSVHSFTPQLRGRPVRPWHLGVLYDEDVESGRLLLELLSAEPDLCVGDNQPYPGAYDGDTMTRHAAARKLPHVVLEIRNDLIADPEGQRLWAERLAPALDRVIEAAAARA